MKGTLTFDAMILISVVVLTFIIIYWSMNYGAEIVESLMSSSPQFVQEYLAGSLSIACMHSGNFSSKYYIHPIEMSIVLTSGDVRASIKGKKYPTEIERGGYIKYGSAAPVPFVICNDIRYQTREIKFNPDVGDKYIEIVRRGTYIGVGVGG